MSKNRRIDITDKTTRVLGRLEFLKNTFDNNSARNVFIDGIINELIEVLKYLREG